MAKFQFFWGGYSVIENTQSPKIWLNFNFRGGEGYSVIENTQSKDMAKFQFSGGGGYSVIENTQSPKIWLNFNFRGVGGIL